MFCLLFAPMWANVIRPYGVAYMRYLWSRQGTIPTADELTDFQKKKEEEMSVNILPVSRQQQKQNQLK